MRINAVIRYIEESEDPMRVISIKEGVGDTAQVSAMADITGEFIEGEFAGRVINTFVWLAPEESGDVLNVTELETGFRLARMPVGYKGETGVIAYKLPDSLYETLLPSMLEACAIAAFHRFSEATDEQLAAMMAKMDSVPRLKQAVTLH